MTPAPAPTPIPAAAPADSPEDEDEDEDVGVGEDVVVPVSVSVSVPVAVGPAVLIAVAFESTLRSNKGRARVTVSPLVALGCVLHADAILSIKLPRTLEPALALRHSEQPLA